MFKGLQDQQKIYKRWEKLIDAKDDIKDDTIKMSTAVVLENVQEEIDRRYNIQNNRGLITEAIAGIGTAGAMGPYTAAGSFSNTAGQQGDARVPSVVIPMIRRIYPQLIAHKLVGVQPMQGPIGMAFAFRAKYGRHGRQDGFEGKEIGYLNSAAGFTGGPQQGLKYGAPSGVTVPSGFSPMPSGDQYVMGDQGQLDLSKDYVNAMSGRVYGGIAPDAQTTAEETAFRCFFGENGTTQYGGKNGAWIGDGADTSDAENWAVGSTMPEAGFEFLKATVTAKTRKLGVQITREAEEDMKAMQGINAQNEVSDIIGYEIAHEIDRQLLGEIVQSAVRAGNTMFWSPEKADGQNQRDRINALYTTILTKSAQIAVQSRRGAANWCVASPGAAALLESHIYDPLGMAGGLGNANAFGKSIDDGIGVVEVGALRNGTIKLYRDSLAGGEYILLGFKGSSVYDAGIIYLPYIPLELMHAVDPFTMNPVTAARTRYGVTTNLFGAGQFYQFIGLPSLNKTFAYSATDRTFVQA